MNRFKGAIKKTFLTGLVVAVPIIVTAYAIFFVFQIIDGFLSPVFNAILGMEIPGLGFLATVVLIFLVGLLATNVLGSRVLQALQSLMIRIPVVKNIYPTIRQLVEAFSPGRDSGFKRVVLVEYPQKGNLAVGFVTNEVSVQRPGDNGLYFSIYIPTNNLYIGHVALFRAEEVIVTGLTVEEGLKIILSGGTSFPSSIQGQHAKSTP
jgi:uncharacterized membrane protein